MSQTGIRPVEDKTTYRITRVPSEFDKTQLLRAVTQVLELKDASGINIHSLAFDIPYGEELLYKAATVTFRFRPALLPPPANEWSFELASGESEQYEERRIYFDTDFLGFTPLSLFLEDSAYTVDCIIIHGWGGHALGSFRSTKTSYTWIRDSLPYRFRQLRVWTYGYNAKLTDEASIADVDEYADSFRIQLRILRNKTKANQKVMPLIFIVHSLGGWIFQKATIGMGRSDNRDDKLNLQSIYGALFFGVPNQGMNVTAMASMIGYLPGRFTLEQLDRDVGYRSRLRQHEEFCQIFNYRDSKIIRFFEQLKSPTVCWDEGKKRWARNGPMEILVSPESATYGRDWGRGGDYTIAINGDHSTMVKFAQNDRDGLEKVCEVIERFLDEAEAVIAARLLPSTSDRLEKFGVFSSESSGGPEAAYLKTTHQLQQAFPRFDSPYNLDLKLLDLIRASPYDYQHLWGRPHPYAVIADSQPQWKHPGNELNQGNTGSEFSRPSSVAQMNLHRSASMPNEQKVEQTRTSSFPVLHPLRHGSNQSLVHEAWSQSSGTSRTSSPQGFLGPDRIRELDRRRVFRRDLVRRSILHAARIYSAMHIFDKPSSDVQNQGLIQSQVTEGTEASGVAGLHLNETESSQNKTSQLNLGTESEDERLWTTAEERRLNGMAGAGKPWSVITKAFPGRTEEKLKAHWQEHKSQHLSNSHEDYWCIAEEKRLVGLMQAGKTWEAIIMAFPNRTDADVKGHWLREQQKKGKLANNEKATAREESKSRSQSQKRIALSDMPWTNAEELKLSRMMHANKSWNDIANVFKTRSKEDLEKHWYQDMKEVPIIAEVKKNRQQNVEPSSESNAKSVVTSDIKPDVQPRQEAFTETLKTPTPVVLPITMALPACKICDVTPAGFPVYTCDECVRLGKTILCMSCVLNGNQDRILGVGHKLSHKIRYWESGVWYPVSMWQWPAGKEDQFGHPWNKMEKYENFTLGITRIPQERASAIVFNPRPKGSHRLGIAPAAGTYEVRFQFQHGRAATFQVSSLSMIKRMGVISGGITLGSVTFMVVKTRNLPSYLKNTETPPSNRWANYVTHECWYDSSETSMRVKVKLPQPVVLEAGEALAIWVTYERNHEELATKGEAIGFWWRLDGLSLEKHGQQIEAVKMRN